MNKGTKTGWDLSFCGLNCAACEIYLASHGDDELHDRLVEFFKRKF